jgi:putative transposase
MDLMHNQVIRILGGANTGDGLEGMFRVILDEPTISRTIVVRIDEPAKPQSLRGGRRQAKVTKNKRKKKPLALVGELQWLDRNILAELEAAKRLQVVEVDREAIYRSPIASANDQALFASRCMTMAPFLTLEGLRQSILIHQGLGDLVREAMTLGDVSRSHVYKLWSVLCRYGVSEISLRPRRDLCGAKGVRRPCSPEGRKKAGRKTHAQRVARYYGEDLAPDQPGMSDEWRAVILAADTSLKTPIKPDMPKRIKHILESGFVSRYTQVNGVLVPAELEKGTYPNNPQIKRVLTEEYTRLERLMAKTTKGHFNRALRALTARNWKGVSGPGHTWAIDSSVGDIYLRSSLNPAWIVGRPIVYVIVDVWSTAVVGFYVCLTGPSWDTAKVSIFNAVCDPHLLAELWGYQPMLSLEPHPTLPGMLLCDRGEYLSKRAYQTSTRLKQNMSYTPPYRPDLKGLVEVLHRIEKDAQFLFVPGAMDYRRKEFELRRGHAADSALTVRQYVQYLQILFTIYNLTADRTTRLDAHMEADGVINSPAGLWRWGHAVSIGYRRDNLASDLISEFLPSATGYVGLRSVQFARNDYSCDQMVQEQWTAESRNFGGWDLPVHYYPGSASRIWTPHLTGKGMLELGISDQSFSSGELTLDEVAESIAMQSMRRSEREHERTQKLLGLMRQADELTRNAQATVKEAMLKAKGAAPTMTDARLMEVQSMTSGAPATSPAVAQQARDDAADEHTAMMLSLLEGTND